MEIEHTHTDVSESKTVSIKIPRLKLPSLQAAMLIFLIAVGILQTAQLYGLNAQISSGQTKIGATGSAASSGGAAKPATSTLPNMVGGC